MFSEWAGSVQEHPGADRNTNFMAGTRGKKGGTDFAGRARVVTLKHISKTHF